MRLEYQHRKYFDMKFDKNTTFEEFLIYSNIFNIEQEKLNEFFEKIGKRKKPAKIAGVELPNDLNELTFGQFARLAEIKTSEQLFSVPFEVILNLKQEQILKCKLFDIISFVVFVSKEIERINKKFESIKNKPSAEEIQAGIEKLNFGLFGLLDWYCRRMGIADHDKGMEVGWLRIFECLRIDNETAKFQENLRKVYEKKNNPKKK